VVPVSNEQIADTLTPASGGIAGALSGQMAVITAVNPLKLYSD
jgi:hypothetical protein